MTLRLRVAELRGMKGWTQEELASRAGVSRVTVVRIESQEAPPRRVDLDVLERLSDALDVDPALMLVRVAEGNTRATRRTRGR